MTTNLALGMALALLLALPAAAQDAVPVPKLTARVIDQTATLSEPQRAGLEATLEAFERERGSQVAVLLVPSTGSETIEEFAGRVADSWQLGRKGVDDGVLFVVAKEQRRLRIHTGRGVQGTLTDALSKRIVSDIVAPRFRANDFAAGIEAGVDAIMKAIEGEELPLPKRQPGAPAGAGSFSELLVFAFFLVPVAGMVLRSMFGRFFGAGITSGVTGVAAWVILGSLGIALVAAVFAFIFTLAGGSGLARGVGRRGGVYIPGGGWGGGGGGGWGGGGGFGGGGGGFDGGGASGSW